MYHTYTGGFLASATIAVLSDVSDRLEYDGLVSVDVIGLDDEYLYSFWCNTCPAPNAR